VGSPHKVTVWTDHANMQYYCHPQKFNRRVAWYIAVLGDYNLKLKHLSGIQNHADGLSRQPDYNQGGDDNDAVTALLDTLFARVIFNITFDEQIRKQQKEHRENIEGWKSKYNLVHWWKLVETHSPSCHWRRTHVEDHHWTILWHSHSWTSEHVQGHRNGKKRLLVVDNVTAPCAVEQ
jgi:hypothetical protein